MLREAKTIRHDGGRPKRTNNVRHYLRRVRCVSLFVCVVVKLKISYVDEFDEYNQVGCMRATYMMYITWRFNKLFYIYIAV